jgi:hypothetical protein
MNYKQLNRTTVSDAKSGTQIWMCLNVAVEINTYGGRVHVCLIQGDEHKDTSTYEDLCNANYVCPNIATGPYHPDLFLRNGHEF